MVNVVGVRFKRAGKIYYFDPGAMQPAYGEQVVVETAEGPEIGEIAVRPKAVPDDDISLPLRRVLRAATPEDRAKLDASKDDEREAFEFCRERIGGLDLQMKLVDVEYSLDRQKLTFYFTAERRVDFRQLVKELAARFRARIELRQIGARDEAKMLDGVGVCGRTLCCSTWMTEFEPVSIRHAKLQDMSLNPSRISGLCGRLKCCLRYEEDVYEDLRKQLPRVGDSLATNRGPAKVVEVRLLKERIVVQMLTDGTRFEITLDQLRETEAAAAAGAGSRSHLTHGKRQSERAEAPVAPERGQEEAREGEGGRPVRTSPGRRPAPQTNREAGTAEPSDAAGATDAKGAEPNGESPRRRRRPRHRRRPPKSDQGA
ncbi:MAG TPA: stage 0 sporulation family protein [Limnochordia bacterium]|nr:stage 0 sporulation family protein [Limnochordia bacterium]